MKRIVLLAFLISCVFSYSNVSVDIGHYQVTMKDSFGDTCACKIKVQTNFKYGLFGRRKIQFVNKKEYKEGKLIKVNEKKPIKTQRVKPNLLIGL